MISAIKPVFAVVTPIAKPLTANVSTINSILKIRELDIAVVPTVMRVTIKKAIIAILARMLYRVHATIDSLFPCLPAYRAPRIAKMMEGNIPIILNVVASPIFPISIPLSIVLTMEAEEACWAILSEDAEII